MTKSRTFYEHVATMVHEC